VPLVFHIHALDTYITLCHTECNLATYDSMSQLAISGTDYFSNVLTCTSCYRSTTFYCKGPQLSHALHMMNLQVALEHRLTVEKATHLQPASSLKCLIKHDTMIEHLESDHRRLTGHEQEMRERKRSVHQRTTRKKKVSGKSCQLHFPPAHLL
jgi:hypothetical protein